MDGNFDPCLAFTLKVEGGLSNHPDDAGGLTQHGIIQEEYDSFRRRKGLVQRSVANITVTELREIYKTQYWDKVDGDQLPLGVDLCVFDAAVNSGPSRGIRWLQQGINKCAGTTRLAVDEGIGPMTLDASDDYDATQLIDAMLDARLGFMKVARNSKTGVALFPIFGNGWQNRLFGYLPKGAKVRNVDGLDDVSKAMLAHAIQNSAPIVPTTVPSTKVPMVLAVIPPKPLPVQPSMQGWGVLIAALTALLYGAVQWAH